MIKLQQSHYSSRQHDSGECPGRQIADDAENQRSQDKDGVDPPEVESRRHRPGRRLMLVVRHSNMFALTTGADPDKFDTLLGREAAEDATETSFAPLEFEQGQQQLAAPEIGPEGARKIEFCVGQLPKKEVADARFSTRPDQEIWVRQIVRIEALLNERFVDLVELDFPMLNVPCDMANSVHHLGPAAIAERDRQVKLAEMSCFLFRCPDPLQSGSR